MCLPTDCGKYQCYALLPLVFNKLHSTAGSAILLVSPLVALMKDQARLLLVCTACTVPQDAHVRHS